MANSTTQISYTDILGRPTLSQSLGNNPNGSNTAQITTYDNQGRSLLQYLPFALPQSLSFDSTALAKQASFYSSNALGLNNADLAKPYQTSYVEPSPLNRSIGGVAPGQLSVATTVVHSFNIANEIKKYKLPLAQDGHYTASELAKTTTTNEQGHVSQTFTNKEGQIICQRTKLNNTWLETYTVYDIFGNVLYLLQPMYQIEANLEKYAFQYKYDSENRQIGKKVPGAGWLYMVYDTYDRLRLSQDANQKARSYWAYTKYDTDNRPIYTGEINSTKTSFEHSQDLINNTARFETRLATGLGYTLGNSYPTVSQEQIYTEIFYDNYIGLETLPYLPSYSNTQNTAVIGQVTGSRVWVIGSNVKLITVNYYDKKYRPIQNRKELYSLNGLVETNSTQYKYNQSTVANATSTQHHRANTLILNHAKNYSYDHADRPLSVQESITIGTKTKTAYTQAYRYDSLGRSTQQYTHSKDGTYYRHLSTSQYNIRGYLQQQNTYYKENGANIPYWAFKLDYLANNQYQGGNITKLFTSEKNDYGFTTGSQYSYDNANRLTHSTGLGGNNNTEKDIIYDANGNIKNISRTGQKAGVYTITHAGNQAKTINNQNINYDANGNQSYDASTATTISYNYLNLPITVQKGNEIQYYTYDATGNKLQSSYNNTSTYYTGAVEYDQTLAPKRISITNGQAIVGTDSISYQYYLKDHLGNNRVMFAENGNLLQRTDFYPFGLDITIGGGNLDNKYLYLDREKQDLTGYLDLQKRFYNPVIGRFLQVDPLPDVEGQESLSSYQYGWNNPVLLSDPLGDIPIKPTFLPVIPIGIAIVEALTALFEAAVISATVVTGAKVITEGVKKANEKSGAGYNSATGYAQSLSTSDERNELRSRLVNTKNTRESNNQKINPKKEAREKAKQERENQPASEKYVKDAAKKLEKNKGKDARREAHDKKKPGEKDRTKKRINEDYKI